MNRQYTRCMWPIDSDSDGRPLECGRYPFEKINRMLGFQISDFLSCVECFDSVLPAKDNTVNGRTIHYMDDLPTEANLTSYEIELLFNRHSGKSMKDNMDKNADKVQANLNDNCQSCKSVFRQNENKLSKGTLDHCAYYGFSCADAVFNQLFVYGMRFYEGLGYYDIVPENGEVKIEPRNELKEMLEVQTAYFGLNHNYSDFPLFFCPTGPAWNEVDVDANGMNNLETDREMFTARSGDEADASALDYEGKDENGKCGASFKVLVLVCGGGDQQDPFFYGEPGNCLDADTFASVYKENFKTAAAPPVVYLNLKNFTHPFSSSCDVKPSCGVKNEAVDNDEARNGAHLVLPLLWAGWLSTYVMVHDFFV